MDFILKNSPRPYTTRQLILKGSKSIKARPAKSKNKVWVASSGMDTDSEEPLDRAVQPPQTPATGHESKTRQGNKLWVARDPARTRKISTHARKHLGLRTPLAASSKVVMDASGHRMTRIPSSSRLTWRRTSTSGSLSVNRKLARCVIQVHTQQTQWFEFGLNLFTLSASRKVRENRTSLFCCVLAHACLQTNPGVLDLCSLYWLVQTDVSRTH